MRTALSLTLALALAALSAPSSVSAQSCQFNGLDFRPLAQKNIISSSDWALFNVYWAPCGQLAQTSLTPKLCQGGSEWSTSGMCRINQFTATAVDIADWSAAGTEQWMALDHSNMQQYSDKLRPASSSGALLTFQSKLSNCTDDGGAAKPYTTSIALLCDEGNLYNLHGPLDMMADGGCQTQMAMLTRLACKHNQGQAEATAEGAEDANTSTELTHQKRRKHMHHSLRHVSD